jgi:phospholipid/cholesterol/gamma-HCH transport system substrate-binding protein
VLSTVNAHGDQLSSLVVTLRQLVSGFAEDREPIGDAIDALSGLATTTSGFLQQGRAPLKNDIAQLGALSENLNDNEAIVEHFIQFLPQKTAALTRTASYGSWFNFYLCSLDGTVAIPGVVSLPLNLEPNTQPRCMR